MAGSRRPAVGGSAWAALLRRAANAAWALPLIACVACMSTAPGLRIAPAALIATAGVGQPRSSPAARLVETTELLPAPAPLPDGRGRICFPGVTSTRRVQFDPIIDRPVAVELALAEPLVAYGHSGPDDDHPPRIALTFDDGPSATYTPQILDLFAEHGARCTFFVLGGKIARHADLIRRMDEEGHEVGIHTWSHPKLTGLSNAAIRSDLARCRSALEPLVERPVRWVRPPYGAVNARVRHAINDAGYRVAMWSIDPRDWQGPSASVVAGRILRAARDGSVVVLHDGGYNRGGTVAAMRTVVPALQKRGFQIVTLSELTGLVEVPEERGMILTIGDRRFRLEAEYEDVRVVVDGAEIAMEGPPVRVEGQFLVHGRPVLEAMGAKVTWDADALAVGISAPRGEFLVKLNSLEVMRDGEALFVRCPAAYYHEVAMLPVWLIANACGATVSFDEQQRTIEFVRTTGAAALSAELQVGLRPMVGPCGAPAPGILLAPGRVGGPGIWRTDATTLM